MPIFAGTAAADRIVGSAAADQLYGLDGNDLLYGMDGDDVVSGGLGDDILVGGLGNDVYDVDSAHDVVVERVGEGFDRVRSSISYVLGVNLEELDLNGTGDLLGVGNALNNTIVGNAGNNLLSGGAGDDLLVGRGGNDVYDVDSAGDKVAEAANDGYDRVRSQVSFALSANVEELNLNGAGDLVGMGNAQNNTIVGNAGNNVLNGGAGDDLLVGRAGNDVYDVDSAGDKVVEAAGEGHDRVRASVSYALGSNVEELNLTGSADINGSGNALDNTIVGSNGANILDGGAGVDVLIGRGGDDTYYFNVVADQAIETANGGFDQILSSVTSITMSENIEAATLAGHGGYNIWGSSSDNIITGNDGVNRLDGNQGEDVLIGGGGADYLFGGGGADKFEYVSIADGGDRIGDFTPWQGDKLVFCGASARNLQLSRHSRIHEQRRQRGSSGRLAGGRRYRRQRHCGYQHHPERHHQSVPAESLRLRVLMRMRAGPGLRPAFPECCIAAIV